MPVMAVLSLPWSCASKAAPYPGPMRCKCYGLVRDMAMAAQINGMNTGLMNIFCGKLLQPSVAGQQGSREEISTCPLSVHHTSGIHTVMLQAAPGMSSRFARVRTEPHERNARQTASIRSRMQGKTQSRTSGPAARRSPGWDNGQLDGQLARRTRRRAVWLTAGPGSWAGCRPKSGAGGGHKGLVWAGSK